MTDYIGQQWGNYRLLRLLGAGGFADVYLGEHIHLGTKAAIKILTTKLSEQEITHFRNEARIIYQLEHPHIIRVLDFGIENRVPFIVMGYAPGGSLRNLHPQGTRLSLQTVVQYVQQIATALQYAHDQKIIHRDVKPANILLGKNNELLLSDFGIAAITHSTRSHHTQDAPGTIHYMAPEQIQGKPRTASDQYALGTVVYEWLTGIKPFTGTPMEIGMQQLLTAPPSLRGKVPTIPLSVEQVVMKALAKDYEQRFANIQAFAAALREACIKQPLFVFDKHHSGYQVRSVAWQHNGDFIASLAVGKEERYHSEIGEIQVYNVFTGESIFSRTNTFGTIAWSPKENLLAFSTHENFYDPNPHEGDIQVINPHTNATLFALNVDWYEQERTSIIAWSPDGKHIAWSRGPDNTAHIAQIGKDTSKLTIHQHREIEAILWSPDGKYIATPCYKWAKIWDAMTGDELSLVHVRHWGKNPIAWSPNGRYIACATWNAEVVIHDLKAKTQTTYKGHPSYVDQVIWSPDSKLIATSGATVNNDNSIRVWDHNTGKTLSVYEKHSSSVKMVDWSPNGKYIASLSLGSGFHDNKIHVWDAFTGLTHILLASDHSSGTMAWSPNGKYLASGSWDNVVEVWQII